MSEDTPELRADATDDQDPVEPTPKTPKRQAPVPTEEASATVEPTCPICGLEVCGHNLPKT